MKPSCAPPGRSRTRPTRHRWTASCETSLADASFVADVEHVAAADRARRPGELAVADAAQADGARRAGHLPGHASCGTSRWSIRTIANGSTSSCETRLLADLEAALEADPLRGPGPAAILAAADAGLPKLWLTRQALHLRRERRDLFGPEAAYRPLGSRAMLRTMWSPSPALRPPRPSCPAVPAKLARGRLGARLLPPGVALGGHAGRAPRWPLAGRLDRRASRRSSACAAQACRWTGRCRADATGAFCGGSPSALLVKEDA